MECSEECNKQEVRGMGIKKHVIVRELCKENTTQIQEGDHLGAYLQRIGVGQGR